MLKTRSTATFGVRRTIAQGEKQGTRHQDPFTKCTAVRHALSAGPLCLNRTNLIVSVSGKLLRSGAEESVVKRKRFSVEQIVTVLKQSQLGMPVADLIPRVGTEDCKKGKL